MKNNARTIAHLCTKYPSSSVRQQLEQNTIMVYLVPIQIQTIPIQQQQQQQRGKFVMQCLPIQETSHAHVNPNAHTKNVFLRDIFGRWSCKHCCETPLQFRSSGAVYGDVHSPYPPAPFVERHLEVCMGNQPLFPSYLVSSHPQVSNMSSYVPSTFQTISQLPLVPSVITTTTRASSSSIHSGSTISSVGEAKPDACTSTSNGNLVQAQDKGLITEYFEFLMSQFRITKFQESDRRCKNNGTRDNLKLNYGGLECRHCGSAKTSTASSHSRKFFWASVDRLANSLSELPSHLVRCRSTPKDVKETLMLLKKQHSKEMSAIPRGSQKVYLRRLWRRIHEQWKQQDLVETQKQRTNLNITQDECSKDNNDDDGSIASSITTDPTIDMQICHGIQRSSAYPTLSSIDSEQKVLLSISDDSDWLSDVDCFLRENLEVFQKQSSEGEVYPRIGIRCIHCSNNSMSCPTSIYPDSIDNVYDDVKSYSAEHFIQCCNADVRQCFKNFNSVSFSRSGKSLKFKGTLTKILRQRYLHGLKDVLHLSDHPSGKGIIALPNSILCNESIFSSADKIPILASSKKSDPLDLFAGVAALQKPIH